MTAEHCCCCSSLLLLCCCWAPAPAANAWSWSYFVLLEYPSMGGHISKNLCYCSKIPSLAPKHTTLERGARKAPVHWVRAAPAPSCIVAVSMNWSEPARNPRPPREHSEHLPPPLSRHPSRQPRTPASAVATAASEQPTASLKSVTWAAPSLHSRTVPPSSNVSTQLAHYA
jgi:hypothetical protein